MVTCSQRSTTNIVYGLLHWLDNVAVYVAHGQDCNGDFVDWHLYCCRVSIRHHVDMMAYEFLYDPSMQTRCARTFSEATPSI